MKVARVQFPTRTDHLGLSPKTGMVLLLSAACCCCGRAAQTNGLVVSAGYVTRFGWMEEPICSVQLQFSGALAADACTLSSVQIKRASDDTGKDLLQTRRSYLGLNSPYRSRSEWYQPVELKCPANSARMIQHLEGEVDLALPTTENGGRFTIENFMARPGEFLRNARLEQFGIKLTYHTLESYNDWQRAHPKPYVDSEDLRAEKCFQGIYGSPEDPPRKSVGIAVDDPRQKLLGLAFEQPDGTCLQAQRSSSGSVYCYEFDAVPPRDLTLVVLVAAPGVIRTERFSVENIWLPWDRSPGSPYADSPELRVKAEVSIYQDKRSTNALLQMTFTGGPITNALGIGRVRLRRVLDQNGSPIALLLPPPNAPTGNPLRTDFSQVETWYDRHEAHNWIRLGEVPKTKQFQSLEGDVEIFHSSLTNGGLVICSNLLGFSGQEIALPGAPARKSRLHFAGIVDFEKQRDDFNRERIFAWSEGRGETATNSLCFNIQNPDGYVLQLSFRAPDGKPILPNAILHAPNIVTYNFRQTLSPDLQLLVYLAAPESVSLYHFRTEAVPVRIR